MVEVEARAAEQVAEIRSALSQAEAIILKHEREAEAHAQYQTVTEQQIAVFQSELVQAAAPLARLRHY